MGGPIVRSGATPEFSRNWDQVFAGKSAKGAKKKSAAPKKPKAPKKKGGKKSKKG